MNGHPDRSEGRLFAGGYRYSLTLTASSYVKFCRLGRFVFVMLPSV
jgi:hypothetical protein